MSWHFSQALVEEYLPASCLGGELSAQSSSIPFAQDDSCSAKMKGIFHHSPFGMMFAPSTGAPGAELLTSFLADSHAPTFPRLDKRRGSKAKQAVCGLKWQESLAKYDHDSRSWKTRQLSLIEDSVGSLETWPTWGFLQDGECWDQTTLAPNTPGPVAGSWPTPCHGSSRWGGTFQEVGGSQNKLRNTLIGKMYVNPDFWESLMGWPIGWTGTAPLETAKIQEWQQQHSPYCQADQA